MEKTPTLAHLEHFCLLLLQVLPELPILIDQHVTLLSATERYHLACCSRAGWLAQLHECHGLWTHLQTSWSRYRGETSVGWMLVAVPEFLRCKVKHRALRFTL